MKIPVCQKIRARWLVAKGSFQSVVNAVVNSEQVYARLRAQVSAGCVHRVALEEDY